MAIGTIDAGACRRLPTNLSPDVSRRSLCRFLSSQARRALFAEATLTPKPALVDRRGSGAHQDLTLASMLRSAIVLEPFFEEIAHISFAARPSARLREELGACGRRAELAMRRATGGSNSHRGAIWCIGLLVAAAAMQEPESDASRLTETASRIASFSDPNVSYLETHGLAVQRVYGAGGARVEAQLGFPHVIRVGLPCLRQRRRDGAPERSCRLDTLLAIMSSLDDTCLLHRGGMRALATAKSGAREVIALGGTATACGMDRLFQLDGDLVHLGASPGGSADLLAATLFLDSLDSSDKQRMQIGTSRIKSTAIGRRN